MSNPGDGAGASRPVRRRPPPSGWLRALLDRLFGYDYFISYAHDDGTIYPRRLRDRLEQSGFRAFLDTTGYVAGDDLRAGTHRRVRMSTYLVVVARPHALRSVWVKRELQTYLAAGRVPVVLNINGALATPTADAEVLALLKDRLFIAETVADGDGEPSDRVIEELRRGFRSTRQEAKRLRFMSATVVVFALLAVAAAGFAVQSHFRGNSLAKALDSEGVARRDAELKAKISRLQLLATQSQAAINDFPERALLLAAEALLSARSWGMLRITATEQALRDALSSAGGRILVGVPRRAVAVNVANENADDAILIGPHGRFLVASLTNQPTRVWDLADPDAVPVVLRDHKGSIAGGVFSPDGRRLVEVKNGNLRMWELDHPGASPRAHAVHSEGADLSFSPDGDWLASSSTEPGGARVVRVSELRRNDPTSIAVPVPRNGSVGATLAPGGRRLAVASGDAVFVWDMRRTQDRPIQLEHPGNQSRAEFSASGRWLVGFGARSIRLWDLDDPDRKSIDRPLFPSEGDGATPESFKFRKRFALSTCRRRLLVIGPDANGRVWDVEAPSAPPIELRGHTGPFRAVAFDETDGRLALADEAGAGRLWNLNHIGPTVDARLLSGHNGSIRQFAFSADGRRIAGCDSELVLGSVSADEHTIWVWNSEQPDVAPVVLRGFERGVYPMSFSPDGRRVIGVTLFGKAEARVWDLDRPVASPLSWKAHDRFATPLLVTPDQRWLLTSGGAKDARLWDLTARPPRPIDLLPSASGGLEIPVFEMDDDRRKLALIGADTVPKIWDLTRLDEPPLRLPIHAEQLTLFGNGQRLATLTKGGAIQVWDLTRPAVTPAVLPTHIPADIAREVTPERPLKDETYKLRALSISPDGHWLIARSWLEVAWVWDLNDPTVAPCRLGDTDVAVEVVTFDRNRPGRLYTAGGGFTKGVNVVRAWDLDRPRLNPTTIGQFFAGGPFSLTVDGHVSGLLLSPDGRLLIAWSSGQEARVLWIWDLTRPAASPTELRGHEQPIIAARLSYDGRRLVSIAFDQTARIWDLSDLDAAGSSSVVLGGRLPIYGTAVFAPGDLWLATGGFDGKVYQYILNLDEVLALAGRTAGRNLTLAEWRRYFPDQPYRPTFLDLPVPPVR